MNGQHCNTHLWKEIPRSSLESYRSLIVRRGPLIQKTHLCRQRPRQALRAAFFTWIKQTVGFSPPSLTSQTPATNILSGSSKEVQLNQMGASRQSGNLPRGGPGTANTQSALQVNLNAGVSPELYVLFGVQGKRRTLELAQIEVKEDKDDKAFFQDIRQEYRRLRGFLRYWLSIWQLRHCDFVKVSLAFYATE
jgi:hypothetical protein